MSSNLGPRVRTEFSVTLPVRQLVGLLDVVGIEMDDVEPDDPKLDYLLRLDAVSEDASSRWAIRRAWWGVRNAEGDTVWNEIQTVRPATRLVLPS